jgi:tetratricopeptide (TPR) repeat protein
LIIMSHSFKHFFVLPFLLAAALLGGCSLFESAPTPARSTVVPDHDMIGAIRAAGDREKSVIDVNPLRDPGVASLQDMAKNDEQAGRYADAAGKLDQALRIRSDSPDMLQDRAEIAIRMRDFATAEKLAHQSWSLGPKLGPLCARNWQTIVEMRLQAGDAAGADTARKGVQACHKAGISRY